MTKNSYRKSFRDLSGMVETCNLVFSLKYIAGVTSDLGAAGAELRDSTRLVPGAPKSQGPASTPLQGRQERIGHG